jgi:hypothetical protein
MESLEKQGAVARRFPGAAERFELQATMTLSIPALGLEHVIDHEIDTGT